jgi:hypothetical protein
VEHPDREAAATVRFRTDGRFSYSFNSTRNLFVCTRLTGISVCFLSSIRSM